MAASGIIVSLLVLTAAPAEVEPWPVLASALVKELRAELLLIALALAALDAADARPLPVPIAAAEGIAVGAMTVVPFVVAAVTVPPGALVVAVPGAVPPEVATYTSRNELGYCV